MLQPADLLLLDEPTNDLDIPTLEILEESLLEYPGALMLVTHDRFMLDRVSTVVLGLDGLGNVERFADYGQWEEWQATQKQTANRDLQPASRLPGEERHGRFLKKEDFPISKRENFRRSKSASKRRKRSCRRRARRSRSRQWLPIR